MMKKIISLLLSISIIVSMVAVNVMAADSEMSLTLSKIINDDFGTSIPYTDQPVTITATYDSGNDDNTDKFVKKSWFRVDLLNENANLIEIYNDNKDKEIIINPKFKWYKKTYRADYKKDITLNGTYIFCGWTSDNENPDYIERIDVTEIELERPMAEVNFSLNGDFSAEIIATAKVSNIECGDDAETKRYNLVKNYLLPPGSWPQSLAPEYCNEVYDDDIAGHYESFLKSGLEPEIIDNTYQLKDTGSYLLFIEDSKGRYNCITFELPTLEAEDTTPPDITWIPVSFDSENNTTKVKFDINDDTNIAKVEYAVLTDKDMPDSENGTDEYFLENNRIALNDETITVGGTFVVCAVDTNGNASYERVELSNSATPEPPPADILHYWDGGIEIIPPNKTTYTEGECLDLTGLEVYATSGIRYSDGTNQITYREKMNVSVDLSGIPLTVNDTVATVKGWYSLTGMELTGTFDITVLPVSEPTKGVYNVTFEGLGHFFVASDAEMTELLSEPYTTTNGTLYLLMPMRDGGGTLTLTATNGTIEHIGTGEVDIYHGEIYMLSGVSEDTTVVADWYGGPVLTLDVTKAEDSTVTAEMSAYYANAATPAGTRCVAAYTDDGRLHSVQMSDAVDAGFRFEFKDLPDNVKTFKAMWWDSVCGMQPIIEAATATVPDSEAATLTDAEI